MLNTHKSNNSHNETIINLDFYWADSIFISNCIKENFTILGEVIFINPITQGLDLL